MLYPLSYGGGHTACAPSGEPRPHVTGGAYCRTPTWGILATGRGRIGRPRHRRSHPSVDFLRDPRPRRSRRTVVRPLV